jgi:cellobiose phosphorylase
MAEKKPKKVFGHFSQDGSEYTVTEPDTPIPFVNYYWNGAFISGASQHLAGIGCFNARPIQYMHPECRALLVNNENRHFYMRDKDSGEFWSPGWYPVLTPLDSYACTHGLGYSRINSSYKKIDISLRLFVPEKEPCEIWTLTVKNAGETRRNIQSFAFVEWLLKGYPEYCDYHSGLQSEYDEASNVLISYNKSSERNHDFYNGFIASDARPVGFDSSKKAFIGYGQVDRPKALLEGKCENSIGVCEKLVGVLQHDYSLAPGESITVNIFIGAADSLGFAKDIRSKYAAAGSVDAEFDRVAQRIKNEYSRISFDIPETPANYIFNHWIKRAVQLHVEVGTNTGKGFRDVLQGAWALSGYDGPGSQQKIIECLKNQFKDGHALRGWNPVDDHHYSDGPVWITPAIDAYLKETRDFGFLGEVVPYFGGGEGTVFEHILQSIKYSTEDLGPHGLIRARYGDWNDSLNMMGIGGSGESVWTSIGMVFAINCAVEIAENVLKDEALAGELKRRAETLKKVINEKGWDGEWYLEGYNDAGNPVGSHIETEGYVYLNPQTWAILSGVVTQDRLPKILKVIDKDLECDYGSLVLTPAYKSPNPGIGRLTWFVPGMWENGSPYCHAGAFKIVADTVLKRGAQAYNTMMKILPDHDLNPSEHSGVPPYMVTNMYYGPEHPRKGQILNTWITGTADWMFKAISAHIIGVSATYKGLKIDPCVPSHWKTFGLKRLYHGAEYDIKFFNPDGKMGETLKKVEVDGAAIEGNILPIFESGKHEVKVYM